MKKNIKQHNIIEKRIKTDIVCKNTIRKELEKKLKLVENWSNYLQEPSKIRLKKKYLKNIQRVLPQIKNKKQILKDLIADLEKRIIKELKFSETEIAELEKVYKKEYEELVKAQNTLLKVKKGALSEEEKIDISGTSIDTLVKVQGENEEPKYIFPKEFLLAKANKRLSKEKKDVKEVNKELDSEDKDKTLFEKELKRMGIEREILK